MRHLFSILLLTAFTAFCSAQSSGFSTAWFGPNAQPVPEFGDATIAEFTSLELNSDFYFGFGDNTINGYFRAEVPLLSEKVSIKLWSTFAEHYWVSDQISQDRNMNGVTSGRAKGDIYVQTRMLLLSEKQLRPALILNSTLKTASGTNDNQSRYFDTPGYYFDLESGKSFEFNSKWVDNVRLVVNAGFLCWQTNINVQNDAVMYGVKLISRKDNWMMENTLSGYSGWMSNHHLYGSDYGDKPLVYSSRVNYIFNKIRYLFSINMVSETTHTINSDLDGELFYLH